jgi:hypothetical protein
MDGEGPEARDRASTGGLVPACRAALAQHLPQALGAWCPGSRSGPGEGMPPPAPP